MKNVKNVGRRWVTSALRSSNRSAIQWLRAALLLASRRRPRHVDDRVHACLAGRLHEVRGGLHRSRGYG